MAGVKREVWTGEAVRQFTHTGEFLRRFRMKAGMLKMM